MGKKRTDLHNVLKSVMGTNAVYYQPPPTLLMTYPCIRYELSSGDTKFADNNPYKFEKRYTISLIDENPDSVYLDGIANLKKSSFDRHYTTDNLHHFVFTIYF